VDTFLMANILNTVKTSGPDYSPDFMEFQGGVRLPLDEFSKVKVALEIGLGGGVDSSPGFCLGYEHALGAARNFSDYLVSWYVEGSAFIPAFLLEVQAGINVRLSPVLLSGRVGLFASQDWGYVYGAISPVSSCGIVCGIEFGYLPYPVKGVEVVYY
jgi:hypothetical protein